MNTIHAKTLIIVVGTLLGIVIGEKSMYASEVGMFAIGLVLLQSVIYFVERKRKMMSDVADVTHHFSFPLVTILFCLGLIIGIVRVQLVEEKTNFVCEGSCTFDAIIVSAPIIKNEYQLLNMHPALYDDVRDVLVRAPLYPRYEIGETLRVSGKVTLPSVIMPHDNTKNNSRGFDYVSYLRTKNIGSELSYPKIEVIDSEAHTLTDVLGRWKENLVTRIDGYVSSPSSSLASGMLFGVTSMSEELLQTFRTAGLSHIIVLSGFNIVIVITSILFVLAFFPLTLRILLASFSVVIFVMMVGGSPSVIRATLIAFIALLAMSVGRQYVAKQALIISLFAIVMYEPYSLTHDVSLHLSFLATMGLVYMSEPLLLLFEKFFPQVTFISLRELLVTTLSAYFATLPYVMYTFGTISIYAIISNILVVPLVPLAMLLSFLVVVSSYISNAVSLIVGFIDTVLISVMIWIARVIESLPFSSFTLTVTFETMCLLYVLIFVIVKYATRKEKDETRVTIENGNLTDIISY